jgi:hypothetical protein
MSILTNRQINFLEELINKRLNPILSETLDGRSGVLIKLGNIALVDAYNDSSIHSLSNTVVVSAVNFEEEKTFKNLPRTVVRTGPTGVPVALEVKPPIFFNLYLLFSANLSSYRDSLKAVLAITDFFRNENVFNFTHEDGQEIRLIFDLYAMGLQDLNNLWGFLGGKSMPSILYKVRLVEIPQTVEFGGNLVEAIRNDISTTND